MSELDFVFTYKNQKVRTIKKDGELWWVLADVCSILGLTTTSRVSNRLDDDEKGMSLIHTPGGKQEMLTINEPGLYSVLLRSDKPEAKPFKRWVTHEVLPNIRKTGQYSIPSATIKNPVCDVPGNQEAREVMRKMWDDSVAIRVLLEQYNRYQKEEDRKRYAAVLESICGKLYMESFRLNDIKYKVIERPA